MDLLDRLLGHDRWTTAQLLERCRELRAEQWIQPFDLGHETLAATFQHMRSNVRVWTDLMAERPVRPSTDEALTTVDLLLFTPEQIQEIFGSQLQMHSVTETVYQGTLDPLPHALFCVLQQKENTP
jgi:uncharacterized damage-inducible protein DinB